MHLKSMWRTSAIKIADVHKLTLVDKNINQNCTEIFESIKANNMFYPIIIVKFGPETWRQEHHDDCTYKIYEDNAVWGVVGGRSRLAFAIDNKYDTIDCMILPTIKDAKNMDDWLRICDPYHNKSCPPLRFTRGAPIDYHKDIARQTNVVHWTSEGRPTKK
jgi:hypothetical protein